MQVVLFQPQIPQNAGNVVRTCAATGCSLVMVQPLGFSTNDRWLKRAGLGYWEGVEVSFIDDLAVYLDKILDNHQKKANKESPLPFYFFSSKSRRPYTEASYDPEALLIFGSETAGLPPYFFERWPEHYVTLPMAPGVRCLNLATTVGIAVYEAKRQQHFRFS